jgi:hypothetical protein
LGCWQVIELPIKHPELFESLGIAQPKVRGENSVHKIRFSDFSSDMGQ